MITSDAIPSLPRGVRVHMDHVRKTEVLLGPERVLMLDHIGSAVLTRVDGIRSVAAISQDLAAVYDAPNDVIEQDVIAYLQDLAEKRLLDTAHG